MEVGHWVAAYGLQNVSRGDLEHGRWDDQGILRGYFIPSSFSEKTPPDGQSPTTRIQIIEADSTNHRLIIFPIKTAGGMTGDLGPKYDQIRRIVLPRDFEGTEELGEILGVSLKDSQSHPSMVLG
ncbi:hypothetical protein CQ011_05370 [Arthrobacter sp. MYb213]|nr:hypothetical protein CQ011_05370 [Arthrobacter sp. MYb213]